MPTNAFFASFASFAFSAFFAFFASFTRQSKSFSVSFNRSTRFQIEKITRKNYKKLNSKKTINIVNNVYYAKQMFKSYIYIICAFYTLQFKENYKLNYVFELINYKKVKKSFY